MFKDLQKIRTSVFIQIGLAGILVCFCIITVAIVRYEMQTVVMDDANTKARMLLDRNVATHHYLSKILKPHIFQWSAPFRDEDYFDPVWMSSTYAVREIDKIFKSYSNERYYYKECAINARSPENEADHYEKEFLTALNEDPDLVVKNEIRQFDGRWYFVTMRRGETMETSCMICHDTPELAPEGLIAQYSAERSFYRHVGDVVSAVSIRIPLETAYKEDRLFTMRLSLVMIALLTLFFTIQFFLNQWRIYRPVNDIRDRALMIASDRTQVGDTIDVQCEGDLQDLAKAFNMMSISLRQQIDEREERIRERTAELAKLNDQLFHEIKEKQSIEKRQIQLINELQMALSKVKQLSGLLPICSSCKKIRDDKGYWNQLETYIHDHSEAEFTHSICEECAKKLYPDFHFHEK